MHKKSSNSAEDDLNLKLILILVCALYFRKIKLQDFFSIPQSFLKT